MSESNPQSNKIIPSQTEFYRNQASGSSTQPHEQANETAVVEKTKTIEIKYKVSKITETDRIRLETRDYANELKPQSMQFQLVYCIVVAEYMAVTDQDFFHVCPFDPRYYKKKQKKGKSQTRNVYDEEEEDANMMVSGGNEAIDEEETSQTQTEKDDLLVPEHDFCRRVCKYVPDPIAPCDEPDGQCDCRRQERACELMCTGMFKGNVVLNFPESFPYMLQMAQSKKTINRQIKGQRMQAFIDQRIR